jgi:hypothetical protein
MLTLHSAVVVIVAAGASVAEADTADVEPTILPTGVDIVAEVDLLLVAVEVCCV